MKKLCTALILCLVSIMAQGQLELIGAYTSCGHQFQILATDPQNGNFIVNRSSKWKLYCNDYHQWGSIGYRK